MAKTAVSVVFGDYEFTSEDIREASVVEEFDPMAITLPISTCDLLLYTEDADFSIMNPFRKFLNFRKKQPLSIYEIINGKKELIGLYFLDAWENTSTTLVELRCVDQIGLLDMLPYDGGIWLTPISVSELIGQFSVDTGIQFQIDPDIENEQITGWIPICTYREALQQVCFAIGAYALTPRQAGFIKIARLASEHGVVTQGIRSGIAKTGQLRVWQQRWRPAQWELTREAYRFDASQIGIGSPITQRPFVSGIEMTAHNYSLGDEEKDLFDGILPVGTHKIVFSEPMHSLNVSGGTIDESGANHAFVTVAVEGNVSLTGKVYVVSKNLFSKYIASNGNDDKESIPTIKDATLVNNANAAEVAKRIFDYYQIRLEKRMKLFAPEAAVGDEVFITVESDQEIRGYIERMEVNLAGGFIAETVVSGDVLILSRDRYAGVCATGQSNVWQFRFRSGVDNQ